MSICKAFRVLTLVFAKVYKKEATDVAVPNNSKEMMEVCFRSVGLYLRDASRSFFMENGGCVHNGDPEYCKTCQRFRDRCKGCGKKTCKSRCGSPVYYYVRKEWL